MAESYPNIDFTKIDFPSDDLTIRTFRRVFPTCVDVDLEEKFFNNASKQRPYPRYELDEALGVALLDNEREIADRAFRVAIGRSLETPPNDPWRRESYGQPDLQDRKFLIRCLTKIYVQLGLAKGVHGALTLIERIEEQAQAQARQLTGPGR